MNAMSRYSRLVAAVACAAVLVGCDSVKDVREAPYTEVPPDRGLIAGTIIGLGTARAVQLRYNGTPACLVNDPAFPNDPTKRIPSDCRFYGYGNNSESSFSFGSFDVGTPYNITVARSPLGKTCTVANATGTVGNLNAPAPVVTCTPDPAVARYSLTVNTTAISGFPDARVTLTTEDGVTQMNAAGQSSVTFADALFNSGTDLPLFQYGITATYPTLVAGKTITNYCTFTPVTTGVNTLTFGGKNLNAADEIVVPAGDVTATVSGCTFPVNVTVGYNGTPAVTTIPAGMQLGLRNHFTREIIQTLDVSGTYSNATVLTFPTQLPANEQSQYELEVIQQPDGHHCVVSGQVTDRTTMINAAGGNVTGPTGSLVMFVDPRVLQWWTSGNRIVRCRALPAAESRLTGTYRRDRSNPTIAQATADPPAIPPQAGEFLTFFDDGTFLYSINWSGVTTCPPSTTDFPVCDPVPANPANARFPGENGPNQQPALGNVFAGTGVVHGFYAYDPVAGTIVFTAFTASNIFPSNFGLNGAPGYATVTAPATVGAGASVGTVTATSFVKTGGSPSQISLTFTGNKPAASPGGATLSGSKTEVWNMTEPESIPGELTGAWVSADHLRMFTFDKGPVEFFHGGVNGLPTLQAACFFVDDDSTQSGGTFIRRSGQTGNCTPSGSAGNTRDVPHWATTGAMTMPRIPPGYNGRFPGSVAVFDSRPTSPVIFSVTPGTGGAPDVLTVQATLFGTPIDQPVSFMRDSAN